MIDSIEEYVETMGLPDLAIVKPKSDEDFLPIDPANMDGKQLADKLFEYSSYVSYLDAELGRIDSQRSIVESTYMARVEERSVQDRISKPKAMAHLSLEDPDMKKTAKKLAELDALYKRVAGMREGFFVRLNACSREISRRNIDRKI